jgi:hypothetical protein
VNPTTDKIVAGLRCVAAGASHLAVLRERKGTLEVSRVDELIALLAKAKSDYAQEKR